MKRTICVLLVLAALAAMLCGCAEKVTVTRGETTENSYTNSSIDVQFTKPDNWRFYSETELAKLMNITAEQFRDEAFMESAKLTSTIEFMAIQVSTGNNVNLTIENLRISGNGRIRLEEYLAAAKKNLQEQMVGATYIFGQESNVTLGGQEYLRMEATCSYMGTSFKQYMYLRKVGECMILITGTSMNGTGADTFEKMFS